jgi:hypothetical protein
MGKRLVEKRGFSCCVEQTSQKPSARVALEGFWFNIK